MNVLRARRGVGGGARTLAPRTGGRVFAWVLGAPPAARVAWVTPLRGASEAGRSPSSGCPPPGGCRGPPPTCCGRGCAGVGVQHCPFSWLVLWGPRAARVAGGCPRGGFPCHRCEGRLVSGAVPPLTARPLGRAAGVPRPLCSGCGRCGRGDQAPAPQRAASWAGVARCGGGRRASPGGVRCAVVRAA